MFVDTGYVLIISVYVDQRISSEILEQFSAAIHLVLYDAKHCSCIASQRICIYQWVGGVLVLAFIYQAFRFFGSSFWRLASLIISIISGITTVVIVLVLERP